MPKPVAIGIDPNRWFVRRIVAAVCLTLIAVVAVLVVREIAHYNHLRAVAQERLLERSRTAMALAASDIAGLAQGADRAAAAIAALLRQPAGSAHELTAALRDVVRQHLAVAEAGIIFEPFAFDPGRRLFAPVARRLGHEVVTDQLDNDMDPSSLPWFQDSLRQRDFWSGPDRAPLRETQVLIRVQRGDDFTVWAAVRQSVLVHALDEVHPADGMAVLVGPGERILASNRATRLDTAAAALAAFATDSSSRLLRQPVAGTPWQVVLVVADVRGGGDEPPRKPMVMRLTAALIVAVAAAAGLYFAMRPAGALPAVALWGWSYALALTFIIVIGAIWAQVLRAPPPHLSPGAVMTGPAAFAKFKRQTLIEAVREHRPIPVFTPTGVFVQAVEFVSANNVVVTGYIWQRFADTPPEDPGFLMPEADTLDVTEIFRRAEGDNTVVGWSFRVTLRQSFGYANFPLDWESVWVRLWPARLDDTEILIPDFAGYYAHGGNPLPGIAQDIVIGGWTPRQAFFEYRRNEYSVNFGQADRRPGAQSELYFNLVLQRTFLDAFVSHMTPIILVLVLLYAMQMTVSRNDDHRDLLGFNAATIITTCAALFFAVLISHIEVRGALAAKQVFYIEYFYFLTYLVILAACVNAILFTAHTPLRVIHYRDNLIPKLLYWPLVTAVMYGVTVAVFW